MSKHPSRLERRDFLKLGGVGIAASALSACATAAPDRKPTVEKLPEPQQPPLSPAKPAGPPRRILGRTGLEVPTVSMGVMNADNPNLVRAALAKDFDVRTRIRDIIRLRQVPKEFLI